MCAPSPGLHPRRPCSPAKSLINPAFHLPSPSPAAPGGCGWRLAGRRSTSRDREPRPPAPHSGACPQDPGKANPRVPGVTPKGLLHLGTSLSTSPGTNTPRSHLPSPGALSHPGEELWDTWGEALPSPRQWMWERASARQLGSDSSADLRRQDWPCRRHRKCVLQAAQEVRFPAAAQGCGGSGRRVPAQAVLLSDLEEVVGSRAPSKTGSRAMGPRVSGLAPEVQVCLFHASPRSALADRSCPGQGDPRARLSHLRQPVALKKTSGSTISRDTLLLPSHQPEKGTMTRSVRTGKASAMSSSFSSSVEDRFQSSPGVGDGHARLRVTEGHPGPLGPMSLPTRRLPAGPGPSDLLSYCFVSPFPSVSDGLRVL